MSTAQKRRLGCWWAVLIPCLLLTLFMVQLLGPRPGIRVGPQTTRLTEPLRSDGLPDYQTRWHELLGPQPSPEDNAAVMIWRAIWPGELMPEHYELVCETLQMEEPAAHEALIPLQDESLRGALCEHLRVDVAEAHQVDDLLERATTLAWSPEELPPLGEWVRENRQPLDWLVDGAQLPAFYSPSPSVVDGEDEMVIAMLLPLTHGIRLAGKALSVRAMGRLAEGDVDGAWSDLLAVYRLARFAARGHTLVEQLVGFAIEGMACQATQTLLHHGDLNAEQALAVRADLKSLPPLPQLKRVLDVGERYAFLDAVTRIGSGRFAEQEAQLFPGGDEFVNVLLKTRVDWNVPLEVGNAWYDRLVEIFELPREQRAAALAEADQDLESLMTSLRPRMARGLFSTQARSQIAADYLMAVFLPSISGAVQAADRAEVHLLLTHVAAELAVYRAQHGAYPAALADLPGEIPLDPFAGAPLFYQRFAEGYLLYSVGQDGRDNGGTDASGEVVRGEWTDAPSGVARGDSDLVVRLPRRGIAHYFPPASPDGAEEYGAEEFGAEEFGAEESMLGE